MIYHTIYLSNDLSIMIVVFKIISENIDYIKIGIKLIFYGIILVRIRINPLI